MQWLDEVVEQALRRQPEGEIIVESGSAPSGPYHVGHLREIITADAILQELQSRGRQAKHVHFLDDFDALRKIPAGIPAEYEKYLGRPLADIPSPEGEGSYADYFLKGFIDSAQRLGIQMELLRGREEYKKGFFTPAIGTVLENVPQARKILEEVSGRRLEDTWSPIQVMEEEYLKKRPFVRLDKEAKTLYYQDKDGQEQSVKYDDGRVKLDWRIDWPARWHQLKVAVEPSGRDHATKGGSIDTGMAIQKQIFQSEPPIQVGYDFVNRAGDTKKMSASAGTGIAVAEVIEVLPPEIVRFFMLRYAPSKRLFFDQVHVAQLIDEFAELLAKEPDSKLIILSQAGTKPVISSVPFTHLVASYQAALKDADKTVEIIKRTEHAGGDEQVIREELKFIDQWLAKWAPNDVKFELKDQVHAADFSDAEKSYLQTLSAKIAQAPPDADGDWFHKAIYEFDGTGDLAKSQLFTTLYKALIGKESGPRAGWFLLILPRDWLVKRLNLEA